MTRLPADLRLDRIRCLRRERPRLRGAGWTAAGVVLLALSGFASGELRFGDLLSERRGALLRDFLRNEALPPELRGEAFHVLAWLRWLAGVWTGPEAGGAIASLAIGVLAVVLAGAAAVLLMPAATRTLMTRDPFLEPPESAGRGAWRAVPRVARLFCVLLRAIPEYIWAFLLLGIFPHGAWPAVLALALHNGGILARLGADTLENADPRPPRSLRMLGAGRGSIALAALGPQCFGRLLLYFFYRFETCLREATVIGMLGILSLGHLVVEARARDRQDLMIAWILLGSLLVLAADLVSHLVRRAVRRQGLS